MKKLSSRTWFLLVVFPFFVSHTSFADATPSNVLQTMENESTDAGTFTALYVANDLAPLMGTTWIFPNFEVVTIGTDVTFDSKVYSLPVETDFGSIGLVQPEVGGFAFSLMQPPSTTFQRYLHLDTPTADGWSYLAERNSVSEVRRKSGPTTWTTAYPYSNDTVGIEVDKDLFIRGIVPYFSNLELEWKETARALTSGGDKVISGYLFASGLKQSWGSAANPEVYFKIWFSGTGVLNVNFFHMAVQNIDITTTFRGQSQSSTIGIWNDPTSRYARHDYRWRNY